MKGEQVNTVEQLAVGTAANASVIGDGGACAAQSVIESTGVAHAGLSDKALASNYNSFLSGNYDGDGDVDDAEIDAMYSSIYFPDTPVDPHADDKDDGNYTMHVQEVCRCVMMVMIDRARVELVEAEYGYLK